MLLEPYMLYYGLIKHVYIVLRRWITICEFNHDPTSFVKGLQQLLVSDKKKIAFLFGAGTSLANEDGLTVPAIKEMTTKVENELSKNNEYKIALDGIKKEIGEERYNVESLLSNVEQKRQVIGGGVLNGLKATEFASLITDIKNRIKKLASIHTKIIEDNKICDLSHIKFAEWLGRASRKYAIEIFTTNYDHLFELALEECNIPYYDGFTGSLEPFFNSESVEDLNFLSRQTKLWKLHGSLGWCLHNDRKKVIRTDKDEGKILIYPSTLKYSDSRKQPYIALLDRLTNFLKMNDTVLITCGYSFNDEHINERILTALSSDTSSCVYALLYDISNKDGNKTYLLTEDSDIAKLAKRSGKISIFGCRNAVIGCQYGKWKIEREPTKDETIQTSLYFDEDGPTDINEQLNKESMGEEKWTGEGELTLPNFKNLVRFLGSMLISYDKLGVDKNE